MFHQTIRSASAVKAKANFSKTTWGWPGIKNSCLCLCLCLFVMLTLLSVGQVFAYAVTTPTRVYGQGGSFNSNTINNGGISADSLYNPFVIAVDSSGGIYVSEFSNNRVLHFPNGSTTADRVYGQLGSFNSNTANNGGLSADSLLRPRGVAVDSNNGLYITDSGNHRVLHYPGGSTTADRVYGQLGSFTSGDVNHNGLTADSLSQPSGVAVDSEGGLYIADFGNSRVLHYPGGSTTADRVYGQLGSFTSDTGNNGGVSANSLLLPRAVALDSSGGLYVADQSNHRVLHYPSGSTTADRVYGQLGNFDSGTANNGGISANSMSSPNGVAVDKYNGLYIVEYGNSRMLHFPSGSTTAEAVYGQNGSFNSGTFNNGGLSANTLNGPVGVAVDSSGGVYVGDNGNNRVLYFPLVSTTTSLTSTSNPSTFGQSVTFTATTSPITATGNITFIFGSGANSTSVTTAVANGVATYITNTLLPGNTPVQASYGGDTTFAPGTSPVYTQTVTKISTNLAVTSSPNPASFGQTATFTATVSPVEATGNVTFTIGASSVSAALSNGIATYVTNTLASGKYVVSANYEGSAVYSSSTTSGHYTHTVDPSVPGTIQWTSSSYSVGEGGGTAVLTVTRAGGSDGVVGATVVITPGTATAADYSAPNTFLVTQ